MSTNSFLFVFVTVAFGSEIMGDEILAKNMNFKLASGDLMPLVGCKYHNDLFDSKLIRF